MEKKYIRSGDIYGKEIQDLYGKETNRVKTHIRSRDIQKENIELI